MTRRILGTSRYLILLAVVGSFAMSALLQLAGVLRVVAICVGILDAARQGQPDIYKQLIIDAVGVIDLFLLGTVLYIVAAGLYQLFVDPDLPLPGWLHIRTLDDLKTKLTGVIVVGLMVAFLGEIIDWQGGTDIVAYGIAIAAVITGVGAYYRLVGLYHERTPQLAVSEEAESSTPS